VTGLALGGAAITPWVDRLSRPLFWAAVMEAVIAISSLAVLPLLDNVNIYMFGWVERYQWSSQRLLSFLRLAVTFTVVIVPTFLMGGLLPLLARVASRERPGEGEPMGWVYSANTAGAIAGAVLAGYALLDLCGVRATVYIASGVSLAVAVSWFLLSGLPRRTAVLAAVLAALAGAAGIRLLPPADPLVTNSGPYLYAHKLASALGPGGIREYMHRVFVPLYFREDAETSVLVVEERVDGWRALRINGKVDASSLGDVPNQVLLAQFPLLLHPRARAVMVLGLASGMTAGSALLHPIESLECLELSPAVVTASSYFQEASKLDPTDPRFHLIINDGRNHLALSGRTYDVIISEPSNPWQAAMSSMFTVEFFTLMRERLNPGGIAVSWIDVYDMDLESLRIILRTFTHVFPYAGLWESAPGGDYILIGSYPPFSNY
jgi:spermidine synthase